MSAPRSEAQNVLRCGRFLSDFGANG